MKRRKRRQSADRPPRRGRPAEPPQMALEGLEERLLLTSDSAGVIGLNAFRLDARFSGIDGSGSAVAVLDTGMDLDHPFFGADADSDGVADRIVYSYDFADGDEDAQDFQSNGSNVASVIGSEDMMYKGIATGVDLINLKVYSDDGTLSFSAVEQALQWVQANAEAYNIVAVQMPVGDGENHTTSGSQQDIGDEIASLSAMSVAVVAGAGDDYYTHSSSVGVGYPAADPNTLSVGATYDSGTFGWTHESGARAYSTAADRIAAFSQRHATLVDIFAPGSRIIGANRIGSTVSRHGTSQAAAHVTATVALIQQLAEQEIGRRLTVTELRDLMSDTGTAVVDGDDEDDNVTNTGLTFQRLDVFDMAEEMLVRGQSMYFDFGTASSPRAEGYIAVTEATTYNSLLGFGWSAGTIESRDRGHGTDLARDFNFTTNGTFSVSVANDTYGVTLTLGDMDYYRDTMKVYIEGVYRGSLTAYAGTPLVTTFEAAVTDGQLDIRLVDTEGTSQCVMINGVAIERGGPRVVEASPTDSRVGEVSTATVTFNESIVDGSFGPEDVTVTGPAGQNVSVTDVVRISQTSFEIQFAAQSEVGTYTIAVGPSIGDVAWNAMDQDRDGICGEDVDDRYTFTFDIVAVPTSLDFGTSASPVAAGDEGIDPGDVYDANLGFGWLSGSIDSRDRASGSDAERDFNYTADGTFAIDTGNGAYEVILTLGDMSHYRQGMEIYVEGVLVDTVTVPAGDPQTFSYAADVTDGQLNIRFVGAGGAVVCVNHVTYQSRGLSVASTDPDANVAGLLDRVTLTFDEAVADGTFTLDDVVGFYNESGLITVTSVVKVSDTQYELRFDSQSEAGTYTLIVGPDITGLSGNAMDEDGDGVLGESIEDRFELQFQITEVPSQFDFGLEASPLETGYTRITPDTLYDAGTGYGWLSGSIDARDRETGTNLTRDFNFTSDGTFVVDVPDDTYEVTITLGDMGYSFRDDMRVYIEGQLVDSVTTWTGITHTATYNVPVEDGQLTIRFFDDDGISQHVMVDAISLATSGLHVTGMTPDVTYTEPVDRVVLTFDEKVKEGSFTLDDVVGVTGPNGAITATAVNRLSDTEYEVCFAEQVDLGAYAITIGPNIYDVGGRPMDTDGDESMGEVIEDRFTGQFTLQLVPTAYDFGKSGSPTAEGYTEVLPDNVYDEQVGYGWVDGSVGAINRDTGDDRTRDFNYVTDGTFEVKLGNGVYDVTLTLGDLGYSYRDNMGVFLEGVQVDTVTTWTGINYTRTYEVSVTDGKLTLRLADQGGIDPYCMIQSMTISKAAPGRFDFGPAAAPVEAGSAGVDASASYNPWRGYGWLDGSIDSRDRGSGSDRTRDFCYTSDGTFAVDLPEGTYIVALTLGDQSYYRAGQEIYLEGVHVDSVTTQAGEFLTRTYQVTLTDGQLTLGLQGLDPDTQLVVMNSLVISAAPDGQQFDFGTDASAVMTDYLGIDPDSAYDPWAGYGWSAGTIDARDRSLGDDRTTDFCFSTDATFSVACLNDTYDVTITVGDLAYSFRDDMRLYIEGVLVDTVTTWTGIVHTDTYQVTVTDGQLDIRLYDPDGLSEIVCIESLEFTSAGGSAAAASAEDPVDLLAAGEAVTLDFGTDSSDLAAGALAVATDTTFSHASGFGWTSGTTAATVEDAADALNGDGVRTHEASLAVDVIDGTYAIEMTVSDNGTLLAGGAGLAFEGLAAMPDATVDEDGLVTYTFTVSVTDGQLNLDIDDGGTGRGVDIRSLSLSAL